MSRIRPIPPDEKRRDLAALRKRKILVTPVIRNLLWIAMDCHDVSRDAWATYIIERTPASEDPIKALKEAIREWFKERDRIARSDESHAKYLHEEEAHNARHKRELVL